MIRKKWKPERETIFQTLISDLSALNAFNAESIENEVKAFMEKNSLGFGDVLPILRIALCGTMKGPAIFEVAELLGAETCKNRLAKGILKFNEIKSAASS